MVGQICGFRKSLRAVVWTCVLLLGTIDTSYADPGLQCWHKVAPGDALGRIASRFTGDFSRWKELAEANPDVVRGQGHVILPGDELRLPESWGRVAGARCVRTDGGALDEADAPVGDDGADVDALVAEASAEDAVAAEGSEEEAAWRADRQPDNDEVQTDPSGSDTREADVSEETEVAAGAQDETPAPRRSKPRWTPPPVVPVEGLLADDPEPRVVARVRQGQDVRPVMRATPGTASARDPFAADPTEDAEFFVRLLRAFETFDQAMAGWFTPTFVEPGTAWPMHAQPMGPLHRQRRYGAACAQRVALDDADTRVDEIVGDPEDPATCLRLYAPAPQASVMRLDAGDRALAAELAEVLQALADEVVWTEAPIGQERLAGLYWRLAVSELLAGDEAVSWAEVLPDPQAIRAACFAQNMLGEADLPDALRAWLYRADIAARDISRVPMTVSLPAHAMASVDGGDWLGRRQDLRGPCDSGDLPTEEVPDAAAVAEGLSVELALCPGPHRLTIQRGFETPVAIEVRVPAAGDLRVEVLELPEEDLEDLRVMEATDARPECTDAEIETYVPTERLSRPGGGMWWRRACGTSVDP